MSNMMPRRATSTQLSSVQQQQLQVQQQNIPTRPVSPGRQPQLLKGASSGAPAAFQANAYGAVPQQQPAAGGTPPATQNTPQQQNGAAQRGGSADSANPVAPGYSVAPIKYVPNAANMRSSAPTNGYLDLPPTPPVNINANAADRPYGSLPINTDTPAQQPVAITANVVERPYGSLPVNSEALEQQQQLLLQQQAQQQALLAQQQAQQQQLLAQQQAQQQLLAQQQAQQQQQQQQPTAGQYGRLKSDGEFEQAEQRAAQVTARYSSLKPDESMGPAAAVQPQGQPQQARPPRRLAASTGGAAAGVHQQLPSRQPQHQQLPTRRPQPQPPMQQQQQQQQMQQQQQQQQQPAMQFVPPARTAAVKSPFIDSNIVSVSAPAAATGNVVCKQCNSTKCKHTHFECGVCERLFLTGADLAFHKSKRGH